MNNIKYSPAKEKNYQRLVNEILESIKSLQLSPSVLENLVQKHYIENKKIISLEGNLLRLAMNDKITREEGIGLVKSFDHEFPKKYFDDFLKYINISEDIFYRTIDQFRSPHLWKQKQKKWILKKTIF